jgi:hypothetical protein
MYDEFAIASVLVFKQMFDRLSLAYLPKIVFRGRKEYLWRGVLTVIQGHLLTVILILSDAEGKYLATHNNAFPA